MLARRTIIGLVVGSVIIAIGAISLVDHLGPQTIRDEYVAAIGEAVPYTIPAKAGAEQSLSIFGESFEVTRDMPGEDVQTTEHEDSAYITWVQAEDGETRIQVRNTGSTELVITGMVVAATDPLLFTYDLMVMIAGIIIIGFSMGFTLRRPKGF